jgi:hypothetical protein
MGGASVTRDRGAYGSFDHDRHWIASWGIDRAAGYVHDRTGGAVLPLVDDVARAQRGAQRWWCASRSIGRSAAKRPVTEIGQALFHTVGDRERAIEQLSTGFQALVNDLAIWQSTNMDHPEASSNAQWLAADVIPTLDEWNTFVGHERKSWWTKLATSWETFENWWEKLKQLRALARAHGIILQSAEPQPLPKTIWEKTEEGKGSEPMAILGVLKIGALGALAIMGAAGFYGAIRNIRSRARIAEDREALREILREELHEELAARRSK